MRNVSLGGETVLNRECLWLGQVHLILVGAQASALLMVAVSLDRLLVRVLCLLSLLHGGSRRFRLLWS